MQGHRRRPATEEMHRRPRLLLQAQVECETVCRDYS